MDAHARHQHYINNYVLFYGGRSAIANATATAHSRPATYESEAEIIRRTHKFLRSDPADGDVDKQLDHLTPAEKWEAQLARAYYDRLFKEYALCDLSRYKTGQIALRWRVEREVANGKGQLSCGNVACGRSKRLKSWEVPFKYREDGEDKRALVKVRMCRKCEKKLHYKKEKERKAEVRKREHSSRFEGSRGGNDASSSESDSSGEDDKAPGQQPQASSSLSSVVERAKPDRARERERSPTDTSSSAHAGRDRDRPPGPSSRSAPSQADLDQAFAGLFE